MFDKRLHPRPRVQRRSCAIHDCDVLLHIFAPRRFGIMAYHPLANVLARCHQNWRIVIVAHDDMMFEQISHRVSRYCGRICFARPQDLAHVALLSSWHNNRKRTAGNPEEEMRLNTRILRIHLHTLYFYRSYKTTTSLGPPWPSGSAKAGGPHGSAPLPAGDCVGSPQIARGEHSKTMASFHAVRIPSDTTSFHASSPSYFAAVVASTPWLDITSYSIPDPLLLPRLLAQKVGVQSLEVATRYVVSRYCGLCRWGRLIRKSHTNTKSI